jgi:hypothetical protein
MVEAELKALRKHFWFISFRIVVEVFLPPLFHRLQKKLSVFTFVATRLHALADNIATTFTWKGLPSIIVNFVRTSKTIT